MTSPLLVGSVAYTPNVVTIWEGIREYFSGGPAEMDFVLFSNYGRQVEALVSGQIDLAWNTNWLGYGQRCRPMEPVGRWRSATRIRSSRPSSSAAPAPG